MGRRNTPQKGRGPAAPTWGPYRDEDGLTTEKPCGEGHAWPGYLFTTALELLVRYPDPVRRLPANAQNKFLRSLRQPPQGAQEELGAVYMSMRLDGGKKASQMLAQTPWWSLVKRAVLGLACGLALGFFHRFALVLAQRRSLRRAKKEPLEGVTFALRNALILTAPWPGLGRSAAAMQMRYNRTGGLAEGLLNSGDHWAEHPITETLVFK